MRAESGFQATPLSRRSRRSAGPASAERTALRSENVIDPGPLLDRGGRHGQRVRDRRRRGHHLHRRRREPRDHPELHADRAGERRHRRHRRDGDGWPPSWRSRYRPCGPRTHARSRPRRGRHGGAADRRGRGRTCARPHLTTQKSFYVEISRAPDRAELVTDDKAALKEQLEDATGERIAALEAVEPKRANGQEAGLEAGRSADRGTGDSVSRDRDRPSGPESEPDRGGRGVGRDLGL